MLTYHFIYLFIITMLQLQLFSMQILQRENEFSAKGLTMDATLLIAVSSRLYASNN